MKKLKHNKLRNTGLIFEILSRSVMYEILNENQPQHAFKLIKNHFNKNSELLKELHLYQTLCGTTENDPSELFQLTIQSRNSLNSEKLDSEKYNLIKSIKSKYDLNNFFETRTANYKLTASVYKLFEHASSSNPDEYLTSKKVILEHLSGSKPTEIIEEQVESAWRDQDPNLRNLSFKLVVEKFNEKYRTLDGRQKTLLSNYINEDVNSTTFKNFIVSEVDYITSRLNSLKESVSDPIVKIKLEETINLTDKILSAKQIKDDQLSSMLKYYELIESLENE